MLNALTFAAMPAMNAASSPVIAIPRTPLGSRSCISHGIVLLYWQVALAAEPGDDLRARSAPGR